MNENLKTILVNNTIYALRYAGYGTTAFHRIGVLEFKSKTGKSLTSKQKQELRKQWLIKAQSKLH